METGIGAPRVEVIGRRARTAAAGMMEWANLVMVISSDLVPGIAVRALLWIAGQVVYTFLTGVCDM
jgi:hypothetical protein